jgi:hypothetical protein
MKTNRQAEIKPASLSPEACRGPSKHFDRFVKKQSASGIGLGLRRIAIPDM